ncbi:MAG: glycosyltransferase family 4 protein [Arcanobacterium sp.]|nr:glycosyltransferase family 4 protein [Arcanobacterium sp.]
MPHNPLNITIATRIFYPEPAAASFRLKALADSIEELGAQVRVVTSTFPPQAVESSITVRRLPALRDSNGYIRGYLNYMSFDIPLFFRLLLTQRPDMYVVEPPPTTGLVMYSISRIKRIPYVYYAADIWSDAASDVTSNRLILSLLRWAESWSMKHSTHVIAANDMIGKRALELGARRMTVIRNGIDIRRFTPDAPATDSMPRNPYFIYAGTASEPQGAGIFIDALRIVHETHPNVELVYIGQGTDWPRLKELSEEYPSVHVYNRLPPEAVAQWQANALAAVVSLVPDTTYNFAYPTKIFAALACGTPVVYAGGGPARSEIEQYHLGETSDYDATLVAEAMIRVINDVPPAHYLRSWAEANADIHQTGANAAKVVIESIDRTPRKYGAL